MRPLRVAVVGAGPAGLYTADALRFQKQVEVLVDVLDRLPTPFGLLRYGVAPDHLKMKSLAVTLQRVLDDPGVRFLGNVVCGADVTLDELRDRYDAVVYAFGAAVDRRLGIPGEDLPGSTSATAFVSWYSGHPDRSGPACSLDHPGVAVVGVGNVAVDVARILAKPVDVLRSTDMPDDVLAALERSVVTDVHVLGRRGPAEARFTHKELRELGELDDVDVVVRPDEIALDARAEAAVASDPVLARNVELLRAWSARPPTGAARRIHLRFGLRPVEVLGPDRVVGLRVERCRVENDGTVRGTGEVEQLDVGAVLRAVGYRGTPIDGVPFDERTGTVPTDGSARVLRDGALSPGEYAVGWIMRGPTGVLGTNRADGQDAADALLADAASLRGSRAGADDDLLELLESRGVQVVSTNGWSAIDAAEVLLGGEQGRPRTKIADRDGLLAASRG
ncbi:MAG: FAD-dependent pyridine nucleotide-disulfide oxidoreductase [Frankiales bacterium]|nr:FAD-dependent pyridine nucleotide-disulfide oxidoreductase [Frankiales bacterium]